MNTQKSIEITASTDAAKTALKQNSRDRKGSNSALLCNNLANAFLKVFPSVTLDDGVLRVYNDGIYQECKNKHLVNNRMMSVAGNLNLVLTPRQLQDALETVRTKTPIAESKIPINLIPVGNGILNIDTLEMSDYSADTVLLTKFPINYNKNAPDPEKFLKMIGTTFDGDKDQIMMVQEMFGYCFLRSYFLEAVFYLSGNGSNGKTTLLNILTELLGGKDSGHISNLSFKEISEPKNENMLSDLYGRYANICGDTGKGKIKETDYIKKASGNDYIRVRKLYKESFSFKNFAKIILSFNQLPEVDDFSDGFKRRIRLLEFNHEFQEGVDANKNLEAEITSDKLEMEGVFLWALVGLKRLLDNKSFSDKSSITARGMAYERKSNPMLHFVRDCIIESPEKFISKATLLKDYSAYAKFNKMPQITTQAFKKGLISNCADISITTYEKRDQTAIGRPFGFMNIDIDKEALRTHTGTASEILKYNTSSDQTELRITVINPGEDVCIDE
jgi:putative DNA primase/helicase